MKKINLFLKNLFFPPRCVGCGELSSENLLDLSTLPFCRKCRIDWEREKNERCGSCGLEIPLCNCGTPLLEKCGVEVFLRLVKYSPLKRSTGKNAVFYMKNKKNTAVFDFFAKELSCGIIRKKKEFCVKNGAILYIPRSVSGINKHGFDQAFELAKRLSIICEMDLIELFEKSKSNKRTQKSLGLNARIENAKNSFRIKKDKAELLRDRDCVFLVDDIMTSGASLAGCILAMKPYYKKKIVCVNIAKTGKSIKNDYSLLQFS